MPYTSMIVAVDNLNIRRQPILADNIVRTARRDDVLIVDKATLNPDGFVRLDSGYWTTYQYLRPANPPPSGSVITVYTTDNLNVRRGPGTNYPKAGDPLSRGAAVRVDLTLSTPLWYRVTVADPQWIYRQYTTTNIIPPPPPPPQSGWTLPFSTSLRGIHGPAGGWVTTPQGLDLIHRNNIKVALLVAYNRSVAATEIPQLRRAGIEHFVLRASLSGDRPPNAADFTARTLPMLSEYAAALGGSNGMLVCIHNEPNLDTEGLYTQWNSGTEFAAWFMAVAAAYRAALPGCKIGYPATSPGFAFGRRMDEQVFNVQARAAIAASDFGCGHAYWASQNGSDFAPETALWKQWFAGKPVIGTEIGPVGSAIVSADTVNRAYTWLAVAGIPCCSWLLDGSSESTFANAAWINHPFTLADPVQV